MRGARVRLELLQFACLIVSQLGSISTLCLIPTVHSFSSLRVQRNTHGVLANPDLSQAMAPSKKKRTHAVFCISSAHRLASTSKTPICRGKGTARGRFEILVDTQ